ncbi:unnamed protein product [Closterium sp. NIES-53]
MDASVALSRHPTLTVRPIASQLKVGSTARRLTPLRTPSRVLLRTSLFGKPLLSERQRLLKRARLSLTASPRVPPAASRPISPFAPSPYHPYRPYSSVFVAARSRSKHAQRHQQPSCFSGPSSVGGAHGPTSTSSIWTNQLHQPPSYSVLQTAAVAQPRRQRRLQPVRAHAVMASSIIEAAVSAVVAGPIRDLVLVTLGAVAALLTTALVLWLRRRAEQQRLVSAARLPTLPSRSSSSSIPSLDIATAAAASAAGEVNGTVSAIVPTKRTTNGALLSMDHGPYATAVANAAAATAATATADRASHNADCGGLGGLLAAETGPGYNGYAPLNGVASNGHALNGYDLNGHAHNGHALNGYALNGYGVNGHGLNGYAVHSSTGEELFGGEQASHTVKEPSRTASNSEISNSRESSSSSSKDRNSNATKKLLSSRTCGAIWSHGLAKAFGIGSGAAAAAASASAAASSKSGGAARAGGKPSGKNSSKGSTGASTKGSPSTKASTGSTKASARANSKANAKASTSAAAAGGNDRKLGAPTDVGVGMQKESVEWVNMVLHKMWKVYRQPIETWLVTRIQRSIDKLQPTLPAPFSRVEIAVFTLDYEPFAVRAVQQRPSRKADDLQYHVGVRYTGDAHCMIRLHLEVGGLKWSVPVDVHDLDVDAEVWVKLRLTPKKPFVASLSLAFVRLPTIKLVLAPFHVLNVVGIPFLSKLLTEDLPRLLVLPRHISLDFLPPGMDADEDTDAGTDVGADVAADVAAGMRADVVGDVAQWPTKAAASAVVGSILNPPAVMNWGGASSNGSSNNTATTLSSNTTDVTSSQSGANGAGSSSNSTATTTTRFSTAVISTAPANASTSSSVPSSSASASPSPSASPFPSSAIHAPLQGDTSDAFKGELSVTLCEARNLPTSPFSLLSLPTSPPSPLSSPSSSPSSSPTKPPPSSRPKNNPLAILSRPLSLLSDPYCRLVFGGAVVESKRNRQTSHAASPGDPVWNQDFLFCVESPRRQKLTVVVRDSALFQRDLGFVQVPLNQLQDCIPVSMWLPLLQDGPFGVKPAPQGEVRLVLTYKSYVEEGSGRTTVLGKFGKPNKTKVRIRFNGDGGGEEGGRTRDEDSESESESESSGSEGWSEGEGGSDGEWLFGPGRFKGETSGSAAAAGATAGAAAELSAAAAAAAEAAAAAAAESEAAKSVAKGARKTAGETLKDLRNSARNRATAAGKALKSVAGDKRGRGAEASVSGTSSGGSSSSGTGSKRARLKQFSSQLKSVVKAGAKAAAGKALSKAALAAAAVAAAAASAASKVVGEGAAAGVIAGGTGDAASGDVGFAVSSSVAAPTTPATPSSPAGSAGSSSLPLVDAATTDAPVMAAAASNSDVTIKGGGDDGESEPEVLIRVRAYPVSDWPRRTAASAAPGAPAAPPAAAAAAAAAVGAVAVGASVATPTAAAVNGDEEVVNSGGDADGLWWAAPQAEVRAEAQAEARINNEGWTEVSDDDGEGTSEGKGEGDASWEWGEGGGMWKADLEEGSLPALISDGGAADADALFVPDLAAYNGANGFAAYSESADSNGHVSNGHAMRTNGRAAGASASGSGAAAAEAATEAVAANEREAERMNEAALHAGDSWWLENDAVTELFDVLERH